jgi:predicted  nucleic acid-binding Zn-ribbon protein
VAVLQSDLNFKVDKDVFQQDMDEKLDRDEFVSKMTDSSNLEDTVSKFEYAMKNVNKKIAQVEDAVDSFYKKSKKHQQTAIEHCDGKVQKLEESLSKLNEELSKKLGVVLRITEGRGLQIEKW